jgi:glycosyltransferase involved in cell wall biosynthesis
VSANGGGRKPRLLVLNQYYWPGVEATANLLTELCEALSADYDVTVVTGAVAADVPARELRNGVRILRVDRALNYLTYVVASTATALRAERPDVVVCMTDPPFLGAIARLIAWRHRAPLLVIAQDVFPEIAVALGRLTSPLLVRVLGVLVNASLRRADRVVVIGETMKRRIEAKGVASDRIDVIPNWGDASRTTPAPRDNEWARRHKLDGKFVVMHFGNVGHAQDLDTLIRATTLLRDLDDLLVPIIGVGARKEELVELARRLDADAVRFLPWQEYTQRSLPISAADLHVVGLARGLAGYVVPSRLYGVLAAGRPVVAAAEAESETAQLVAEVGCGIAIEPGDPLALAEVLRAAHGGAYDLAEMGRRARAFAETASDRSIAVGRYRAVLDEIRRTRN